MAKIDLSRLNTTVKNNLKNYADESAAAFEGIGLFLQDIYKDKPNIQQKATKFTKDITTQSNWSLNGIEFGGLRIDSSKTGLNKKGDINESVYSAIDSNLLTAIKFCKYHISLAKLDLKNNVSGAADKLNLWKYELNTAQQYRACTSLMKLQAQSVVAEALFDNTIDKFQKNLDNAFNGTTDNQDYANIKNNIGELQKEMLKYSLYPKDAQGNSINAIDQYSSDDALNTRKSISQLCNKIKKDLMLLKNNNLLQNKIDKQLPIAKNADYLMYVLNQAHGFAKAKNDLNYSNPTKISTFTKARQRITSVLERVSLVLGITAISSSVATLAVPIIAPITGATALVSGLISAVTGLTAAGIKSGNAITNYAKYRTLPTKEEVATVAISAIAIGAAGVKVLGPAVNLGKTTAAAGSEAAKTKTESFKEQVQNEIKKRSSSGDLKIPIADSDEEEIEQKNMP